MSHIVYPELRQERLVLPLNPQQAKWNVRRQWRYMERHWQRFGEIINADLLTWSRHFLPAHFRLPPSAMHVWLAQQLDAVRDATQAHGLQPVGFPLKLNVVGPRGSAKSTVVTLAHVLREALSGREPYIWIVSDTRHQACAHLDNVKAELEDNDLMAEAYPQAAGVGPVWRRGCIILRNAVMIEAFGTGQRVRGRRRREHRPTLIVCDDLQNDGHIQSALARDRSRTWFHGMLMKAGTPRTSIINLGTALHRECLAMELHGTPGWTSRKFRAIERWPDQMPLWAAWEELYCGEENSGFEVQGSERSEPGCPQLASASRLWRPGVADAASAAQLWRDAPRGEDTPARILSPARRSLAREFYQRNRDLMHAGAVLLWPEAEDLYTLMCMRAESGSTAFEREKQSAPVNPELCEWPEEYFGDWIWFDEWPRHVGESLRDSHRRLGETPLRDARLGETRLRVKVLALDPSKGSDARRGDYSAFVMLGVTSDGTLFVEADLARRPTPQIVTDGVELCRWFRPQAFGIESNQFQELLGSDFAGEFIRQGMIGIAPCSIENRTHKFVRIRRLGPLLAARRLRFKTNSPGTRMLVDQLKEFPLADHDDGPDALEMALRLAEASLRPAYSDGLGDRLI